MDVNWSYRSTSEVQLVGHHGSDNSIVSAARVSYGNGSKGEEKDKKLIRYLLANKHTSPFEHVSFTLRASVPLFVARQWMRHRTWSFNEVSYRYTLAGMVFYRPAQYRKQSTSNKQMSDGVIDDARAYHELDRAYRRTVTEAIATYEGMIEAGVSRELARIVLPVSLYTELYASVNLHNILKFLEQRLHPHAQQEIREVAVQMRDIVRQIVPWTIEIWEELNGQTEDTSLTD